MSDTKLLENVLNKGTEHSETSKKTTYFTEGEKAQLMLCKALSDSSGRFDAGKWLNDASVYQKKYNRLRYAEISNYVFSHSHATDEETVFTTNLDAVYEYIQENYNNTASERKELFFWFIKFRDHVTLALHQAHLVTATEESLKSAVESEVSKQMTNSTNEIMSQLVGLISIFTALSFVLFGGISSLESIFHYLGSLVTDHSRWFHILPPIIVALIWSFCMINMLFIFVIFVLRIINRPLHEGEDNPVAGRATTIQTFRRFQILLTTDYVLFVCTSFLSLVYFIGVTKTGTQLVSDVVDATGYLLFVIFFLLILAVSIYLYIQLCSKVLNFEDAQEKNKE